MRKYLVKRLLLSVVILFFVTFIIYLLMRCMPSSYVENMARQLSQAPGSKPYEEWLAQLNAQYGLDLRLIPGFFVQLKNLCTGNFGDSRKYTVPVIQKFNEVIWVSFIMGYLARVRASHRGAARHRGRHQAVQRDRLHRHDGRTAGYVAADVLLRDALKAHLLHQARLVRPCRPHGT